MRLVLGKGGVRPQEGWNLAPRVYSARDAPAVGLVPAAVFFKADSTLDAVASMVQAPSNQIAVGGRAPHPKTAGKERVEIITAWQVREVCRGCNVLQPDAHIETG